MGIPAKGGVRELGTWHTSQGGVSGRWGVGIPARGGLTEMDSGRSSKGGG